MFITTNENHSIRFILKSGVIVFLAYRFQYGNEALPLIQKMESGVFSFKQDVFVGKDDPTLLDTVALLQILNNTKKSSANNNQVNRRENHHAETFFFDKEMRRVKAELSLLIGPIAQVICEEYIDDYGQPANAIELKKMLAILAEEIDDKEKREQFKQKLMN